MQVDTPPHSPEDAPTTDPGTAMRAIRRATSVLAITAAPLCALPAAAPAASPAHAAGPRTPQQVASATSALSGTYAMQNKKTGRCADLPGVGPGQRRTPVTQSTCTVRTSDNQRWRFVPMGQTQGSSGTWYNRYQIVNATDGLCLDAPGFGDNSPGALVIEYTCRG